MRVRASLLIALGSWAILTGCDGAVSPEGRKRLLDANVAYQRGDDAAAVASAGEFLKIHPNLQESAEALYVRGLARCRMGQAEAGKEDLASALRLTKRKDLAALAALALGNLAYTRGDMGEAESCYRTVLESVPPGAPPADQAMYRLGCILQHQGRWAQADVFFDRLGHLFDGTELARRAEQRVHATRWSIQAGAFANLDVAVALRDRLTREGLPARMDTEIRNERLMRLVRVGSYRAYAEAEKDLSKVRTISADAYVTPAR